MKSSHPPITQITFLKFLSKNILLAAVGSFIKIVEIQKTKDSRKVSAREENKNSKKSIFLNCFPGNDSARIHSIQIIQELQLLVVFGSKSLIMIKYSQTNDSRLPNLEIIDRFLFNDWIRDVAVLETSETAVRQVAILFSHNFVQLWDLEEMKLISSVQSEERCMLYSGKLVGGSWKSLTVASGTIFNQGLLWNPTALNEKGDAIVQSRLIGHEGVLFGIEFSPKQSQIATLSDDRTIRIWNTESPSMNSPIVLKGHLGRVWKAR